MCPQTCPGWAHPRECGADATGTSRRDARDGSSPRVRGRLLAVCLFGRSLGLIPASAGQTCMTVSRWGGIWAHPRECGADGIRTYVDSENAGSSPRVRGRLTKKHVNFTCTGLIPASAGQTSLCALLDDRAGAHPRECGADHTRVHEAVNRRGSSPRVRGRRAGGERGCVDVGLIPASAGQTPLSRSCPRSARAHPRECGADNRETSAPRLTLGSSPRVRGRRSV